MSEGTFEATTVLLVEDELIVRGLIQELLESQGYVVFTASDAAAAREIATHQKPHVLVADIQLGAGPNGFDLAHALSSMHFLQGIVFLTNVPEPRLIGVEPRSLPRRAVYLNKSRLANSKILVEAIEASRQGKVGKELRDDLAGESNLPDLSRTQIEVLRLVADGLSNQQIAEIRGTGIRAVENLLHRAYIALGIDTEGASTNIRVNAALAFLEAVGLKRG